MLDDSNHPSNSRSGAAAEPLHDRPAEAQQSQVRRFAWQDWPRWRLILAGGAGAFLVLILILLVTAPLSKSLQPITAPSLTLLSAEGLPIARKGAVVEAPVRIEELPEHVVQPFLAIEDRRFYNHAGLDPQGLARAALSNARAGEGGRGRQHHHPAARQAGLPFLEPHSLAQVAGGRPFGLARSPAQQGADSLALSLQYIFR